jgi:hypothetical protein
MPKIKPRYEPVEVTLYKEIPYKSKNKPYTNKTQKKRAVLWLNIDPELKHDFAEICIRENKRLAEFAREVIREYVENYKENIK